MTSKLNEINETGKIFEKSYKEISNKTIAATKGFEANYSRDLKFNNVNIIPAKGDVFTLTNSSNYILNDVYPAKNGKAFIKAGTNTSNILIQGKNAEEAIKQIVTDKMEGKM